MSGRAPGQESGASDIATGLGRAFAGALIFGLPMLMTMELWELGARMNRLRLGLLVVASLPLLVGIAHRIGFEATFGWREDLRDALIALGIAACTSAAVLGVFGLLGPGTSLDALAGHVAVQTPPAAIGALLARSQFGGEIADDSGDRALAGWAGTIFLMLVGALFLSLNVAPTEEMMLIAFKMTPWHALTLVALSLAVMHGFVYALAFRGGANESVGPGGFMRFTVTGYALSLAISVYVLWTFGRLDGLGAGPAAMATVVLAFPAAVGAAAARLIL